MNLDSPAALPPELIQRYLSIVETEPRLQQLPAGQRTQLAALLALLLQGQERLNLTAIKEPAAIARLHFSDSLAGLDAAPEAWAGAESAADVGSGGGFPLLPLALLVPGCRLTAVESVGKKARFIEETARQLGLDTVLALASRAENVARSEHRESFDVVTARAVGPIVSLCEVCLPLLRQDGLLLLYKTETAFPEMEGVIAAIRELGGSPEAPYAYQLAGDHQDRVILKIRKVRPTPDRYPRAAGIPFKKLLVS